MSFGQLGTLALVQRNYPEAKERCSAALQIFQTLGEPQMEATAWRNLGLAAEGQDDWAEAERCCRESLAIEEQHGNRVTAAQARNQLGIIARAAGRPADAEAWLRRALSTPNLPLINQKRLYNNLANLLLSEVQEGRFLESRLAEAQRYAERSLEICETLDPSSAQIWATLNILTGIAELQGDAEAVRDYRKREREAYAAFEGNRYHIDQLRGELIQAIAAAAQGDEQRRAEVEARLPQIEEAGWRIADATRRIWAGQRDWHALVEGLDPNSALLILRVLETIEEAEQARQE